MLSNVQLTNPNCDMGRCIKNDGEVRKLPIVGGGNGFFCEYCFNREIDARIHLNAKVSDAAKMELFDWEDLEIYRPE